MDCIVDEILKKNIFVMDRSDQSGRFKMELNLQRHTFRFPSVLLGFLLELFMA